MSFEEGNLIWPALLVLSFAVVVGLQWYRSRPVTAGTAATLPGAVRRAALRRLERAAVVDIILLAVTPLFLYALLLTRMQFAGARWNPYGSILLASMALGFGIYFGHRLWMTLRTRRQLLRSIDDFLAAALTLDRLAADGWRVFHDFRAGRLAIDHVVLGAAGVFAVQTHSPLPLRKRPAAVAYDGRALYFQSGTETEILQQARRSAAGLARWIEQAAGETVAVRAVVILPGWQIKRTDHRGIPVVRLQQIRSLFRHVRPRPLAPASLQAINRSLASRCRVHPSGERAGLEA
jgi:hypothetical protein